MPLTLTLPALSDEESVDAAIVACRALGHDHTDCPDQADHIQAFAAGLMARSVAQIRMQLAEEAARASIVPPGGRPVFLLPGQPPPAD